MTATKSETMKTLQEYGSELQHAVDNVVSGELMPIIAALNKVRERHGTVYVAGNGGSAANASHMACHLMDVGIKAMCLTDNAPLLTALSNDFDYSVAFVKQVEQVYRTRDAICIFSCSGQSDNVVGLSDVRTFGDWHAEPVIAFLGKRKGGVETNATPVTHVDATHPGVVEDVHSAMIHMVKEALMLGRG